MSKVAKKLGLARSLFSSLFETRSNKVYSSHMLNTQYRMVGVKNTFNVAALVSTSFAIPVATLVHVFVFFITLVVIPVPFL